MISSFKRLLMATAIAATPAFGADALLSTSVSTDADGVRVQRGADFVSVPSMPDSFYLDARTRPPIAPWKPGDPIREIPRLQRGDPEARRHMGAPVNAVAPGLDPLADLQRAFGDGVHDRSFSTPLVNGIGQGFSGVFPPDPSGDVGGGFYIQAINGSGGALYTIYNTVDGTVAAGPFSMDGLGSGGPCASGFGDGVVVFDQLADRWVLTEFSQSGNNLCVYLSATNNPVTTTWTRYAFVPPSFPDYPKYGVWPDAYYVGANEGPAVYAFDRVKMLNGQPATMQRFTPTPLGGLGFQMLLPASANGIDAPPAGSAGTFVRQNDDERNNVGSNDPAHDFVELFKFHVDWTTPANSTLTGPIQIQVSEFDTSFNVPSGFGAIPQPGTSQLLDPLLEVVMNPFHYRNFGDHETLVGNFVTKLGANNLSGVRWFEMRRTGGDGNPWTLYQEGTYAPNDAGGPANRWMAASAMDSSGNIALGYSVDRATPAIFPSLSYVGRQAGDPAGVMTSTETSLVAGESSQTNADRWGDYFQMGVDPIDGCTFWFTGEYMPAGGQWTTRVASFRFDACGTPTFTLSGTNLTQNVCAASATPTALQPIALTIGSIAGYTTPVALSFATPPPTGFGGSFTVTPVTPPGTSEADLTVDNTAAPGANTLTLRGHADTTDRDLTVNVNVSTMTPPVSALTAPANNATAVPTRPVFSWSASAQAASYLIEIATDAAFSSIILSQTVNGTSFQPIASLPNDTQIYWRVTPNNVCGNGVASAVSTFRTQLAPGQCAATDTTVAVFTDDIESGAPGWTHGAAAGADTWAISTARPNSPTHAWKGTDPATVSDQRLVSPTIALPATALSGLTLQFDHWRNLENQGATGCYDGGMLEISLDGGAFTQIPGSLLATSPYTGAIGGSSSDPLAGSQVWCNSVPYTHAVVDVSSFAGHNAQFRFRLGSDSSVGREGWYIDDVKVLGCQAAPVDRIFANDFDTHAP